jgi:glycosyl transferase family 25
MDGKQSGSALLSVVDHVFVINLPHRTDRRDEMAGQLARVGLGFDHPQVTLFPAVRVDDPGDFPTAGVRGCFLSHLGVLRTIAQAGLARALVLEDDADFSQHFETRLPALAPGLAQAGWDMFYGWPPGRHADPDVAGDTRLRDIPPDQPVAMLHFFAITGPAAARCVPFLEAMLDRPLGDPAGGPMHVDGAMCWFRAANPDLRTLAPEVPLSVQRSSRSDITRDKWFDRIDALAGPLTALRRAKRRLKGG